MNKKFVGFIFLGLITVYSILNLGKYLDISKKPEKSEIIICLGGGVYLQRIKKSIQLYKNGYSSENLVLITGGTAFTIKDSMQDSRIKYISKNESNINYVYHPYVKNTFEELSFLKEYMKENGFKKVLIISDGYHSRRISILADFLDFEDTGLTYTISSANLKLWNKEKYYENTYSLKTAFSEFIKIPYNFIKYSIIPTKV